MQQRHKNRKQYFDEQITTTEKYVIPYIEEVKPITQGMAILEVGCGEGGNLIPFLERGCIAVGVDLNKEQVENAKNFISDALPNSSIELLNQDVYELGEKHKKKFDFILLRDVIEHIHDQNKFMKHIKMFLKEEGRIFFGFPPWRMPFGGHQQICNSKLLSKLPYFHLFPKSVYRFILKLFREPEGTINELIEIKETGISICRFERIIEKNGYFFEKKTNYLINPNYEIKFGLKPRKLNKLFRSISYFKDFYTTCCYYIVKLE